MKILDDKILEQSAKRIVGQIDEQGEKMLSADKCEKTYFSDIKAAKAKASARSHINRTIRICAVAAVLMVGLVCALFMGAKEEGAINIETDAYMWRNNSPNAENMEVKVKINFEQEGALGKGDKNSDNCEKTDSEFMGSIVITDFNGNVLYNFCHIQLFLSEDYKYPAGLLMEYADRKECPNGHKDEECRRI